ncbi:MAG: acetyltransferase [candidate division Zixibacteria bacterium SM23_73]|nr:MAG: acetyltransferase [candidate division Zixibacteria bacterium SM23_73]
MVKVEIREATDGDLPAILSLYAQPDVDNGKVLSIEQAQKIFARIRSYPEYRIYIAKTEDKIIGTFALLIMDNLAHMGAPSGIVEDMVVDPSWQGKGIGKQMMEFARECCRERGCYKLALSSNLKREIAHRFYESLGFQRHGYSFIVEPTGGKKE